MAQPDGKPESIQEVCDTLTEIRDGFDKHVNNIRRILELLATEPNSELLDMIGIDNTHMGKIRKFWDFILDNSLKNVDEIIALAGHTKDMDKTQS